MTAPRPSVLRKLRRARTLIYEGEELEQAEDILVSIENEKWLNLYELHVLEQSYGMLSFTKKNFKDAITRFERSNRFGNTRSEELAAESNLLLVMSYVNSKDFKAAVKTYDKLTLHGKLGESERIMQTIEFIRQALEDGRAHYIQLAY